MHADPQQVLKARVRMGFMLATPRLVLLVSTDTHFKWFLLVGFVTSSCSGFVTSDCAVGIATGHGLDEQRIEVRILVWCSEERTPPANTTHDNKR
jgi:hypothetical protein